MAVLIKILFDFLTGYSSMTVFPWISCPGELFLVGIVVRDNVYVVNRSKCF
jgi:hypothetical protein